MRTRQVRPVFWRRLFLAPITIRYSNILYSIWVRGMLVLALPAFFLAGAAGPAAAGELVVLGEGFAHDRGQAVANLFRRGDDIFSPPYRQSRAPIRDGRAALVFGDLPHGAYAVVLFHDVNGNGDLDHNFFRLPAEPLGFSGQYRFTLFSGRPSFEKLKADFGARQRPWRITVD